MLSLHPLLASMRLKKVVWLGLVQSTLHFHPSSTVTGELWHPKPPHPPGGNEPKWGGEKQGLSVLWFPPYPQCQWVPGGRWTSIPILHQGHWRRRCPWGGSSWAPLSPSHAELSVHSLHDQGRMWWWEVGLVNVNGCGFVPELLEWLIQQQ